MTGHTAFEMGSANVDSLTGRDLASRLQNAANPPDPDRLSPELVARVPVVLSPVVRLGVDAGATDGPVGLAGGRPDHV